MKKVYLPVIASFFFLFLISSCTKPSASIDLCGTWQFAMDPDDLGIENSWYNKALIGSIQLPGSMMEQRIGFEPTLETKWTGSIYDSSWFFNPAMERFRQPGNLKFPFWLTPEKYYVGPAWYAREIDIPKNWNGKELVLHLERPHWETTVWVNGQEAGMQNSLSTPHEYNITRLLKPGKNKLTIRVDNRTKEINVGPDSHSITDHTQGNWNGIVGKMTIEAKPAIHIQNVRVYPDIHSKTAKVKITFNRTVPENCKVKLEAKAFNTNKKHRVKKTGQAVGLGEKEWIVDLEMGNGMLLWDEFDPALYQLAVSLKSPEGSDRFETSFGMREFGIEGTQFTVNGRRVFLRGNVDCAAFPLTGYPPMEIGPWLKIFNSAKAYGLNHVRYHSWCPPRAAFEAADLLGIYLQPEGPSWANHGTAIGNGWPVDQYLMDESERIIDHYGNYASFCMMAYGNEPAGRHQVAYLTQWVNHFKAYDPTKLYTSASIGRSWPLTPVSQFIVRSEPRGLPWDKAPQSMFDYSDKLDPYSVPYVAHEMGQYCVFPNFDEMKKYTGVYKPLNYELFKETLEEKGMGHQARDFFMASGTFQALCYKNEIEAALRTPGFAGIQLLGLNDFPGQGTALVGVTDAFWEEKDYISPKAFRDFCSETVLLARIPKFVYTTADTLFADLEMSHYGPQNLSGQTITWSLYQAHDNLAQGSFDASLVETGGNTGIGTVAVPLSQIAAPAHLKLQASAGTVVNEWEIWVYPAKTDLPDTEGIYVTGAFDKKTMEVLENGGKVFLHAAGKVENGKDVVQYFRPVFWNTSWFQMRPPHTLGILCDPAHPALALFPTQFHSNMQWWEILHNQQVMNLDWFPQGFAPIVQPIDTWFLNRKLGLVFEAKAGNGKIIVCSADLLSDMENRPAARQLYTSLIGYMKSDKFEPATSVKTEVIEDLFIDRERDKINFFTKDSPDELKPKNVVTK